MNRGQFQKTHGHWSPSNLTYRCWQTIRQRCYNKNHDQYKNYGGRGISVCGRWLESFENFLADMGEKPSASHSIDRINNDGNYEPSNCRWSTSKEQCSNRRGLNMITHAGETRPLDVWSKSLGFHPATIRTRLKTGLTFEQAISIPKFSRSAMKAAMGKGEV